MKFTFLISLTTQFYLIILSYVYFSFFFSYTTLNDKMIMSTTESKQPELNFDRSVHMPLLTLLQELALATPVYLLFTVLAFQWV